MKWTDKLFKVLHLTSTEITVLTTLSEAKSVQKIAYDTKLSRTGINHVIKSLIERELVTYEIIGKRKIYKALTNQGLYNKFEKILSEIKVENRKGAKIKISKEDEFIIHIGVKEIMPAYQRIAAENKNERIRAIQHHRSWRELIEKISPNQLVKFNESIKKNHIILDGMLNKSAYDAYRKEIIEDPKKHAKAVKSLEGRMADYTVFDDKFFNYDAEIWIFRTTTLLINWKEEVAIEITNANMTGFLKDMFEFVKEGGNKLDHNQAIRELLQKN